MTTVYVLMSHSTYDGSYLIGVYTTRERAVDAASRIKDERLIQNRTELTPHEQIGGFWLQIHAVETDSELDSDRASFF